jgi:hypothetical protein
MNSGRAARSGHSHLAVGPTGILLVESHWQARCLPAPRARHIESVLWRTVARAMFSFTHHDKGS